MSTMGITADAVLRTDDCLSTALMKPKDEEQLTDNRIDARATPFRTEFKCESSSRLSNNTTTNNNNNTTTTAPVMSNRVSSPVLMFPTGSTQTGSVRGSDHTNPLRTTSREPCLRPQLNYIPPGLQCQLSETGDHLEVCALGRFAAGHVWGPYLIHLSPECRQRLRGSMDEHHPSIAVKNDGTIADPNAIVLGEEHTWIKLLHESGLRTTSVTSHDPNVDLLVDPISKTITLIVTTEIKPSDPLRGSLRIRSGHSISPTQLNDSTPGCAGPVAASISSGNNNNSSGNTGSGNSKSGVQLSPGSHTSSSTSPGSICTSGVGAGPKRDKKCTYCGIPFSNLDTLTAHMTHYCSRRPLLGCATHQSSANATSGSLGNAVSSAGGGTGGGVDPGGTAALCIGKSGSNSSGPRVNGSKRPVSRSNSTSVTDQTLFSTLPNFTGQLPFFPGTAFDKLGALSNSIPLTESLAPHTDYADFSASLLGSALPAPFASTACAGANSGNNDPAAAAIRASLAATMLPYLARLLPTAAPGPVCTSTALSITPRPDVAVSSSTAATNTTTTTMTKLIDPPAPSKPLSNPCTDVEMIVDKRIRSYTSVDTSLPDVCDTPNLSDRIIPSPLYCNGCQRFFASGHLYSCHLQMSYRLLKTTDSDVQPSTSSSSSSCRPAESVERDGSGSNLSHTFQLADAASRLGLVLAAPLVTTNGVHYVPVHPSCGSQFERNHTNNHPHSYTQQQNQQQQQYQTQPQHNFYRTSKRTSPGTQSKGLREGSVSTEHESVQSKVETNNPPTVAKLSGSRGGQVPSKILDLSCSPYGTGTNSFSTNPGRESLFIEQQTASVDGGLTRPAVPNGVFSGPSCSATNQLPAVNDVNPYSNLVINLLTQLMMGTHDTDLDVSGSTVNLPQLMAQLYSAASLYCPGTVSTNNPTTPSVPASTSVPLVPLFAPFWLAPSTEVSSVVGIPSSSSLSSTSNSFVRSNPSQTSPPGSPKSNLVAMDLLTSVYPSALYPTSSLLTSRTDLPGPGKSSKPNTVASITPTGQSGTTTLQTSPTGSPESPNCRPFLCTYCQTRFQAYTTYMAHQDIYCQARREALKNMRVPPGAISSTGNSSQCAASTLPAAVAPGSSASPTGSLSGKRRRIQSPGPSTSAPDLSKSNQDQSQSSSSARLSPNAASSVSGGSGDDDHSDAVSPSAVKSEPVTGRRSISSHLEPDLAAAEAESSSSSGPQWEACGPSELRCSACGYVGQTARGMKMHRRLHDCNGTGSR